MGNDKTSVLALFPEVNHKTISFEKYTAYLHAIVQTKKNAILVLTPTLNLTQTVTLALINPNVNPNLNLKSKPQLTTNDNNLKNESI